MKLPNASTNALMLGSNISLGNNESRCDVVTTLRTWSGTVMSKDPQFLEAAFIIANYLTIQTGNFLSAVVIVSFGTYMQGM